MKTLNLFVFLFLSLTTLQAQTFQDYLNEFPTVSTATWLSEDLEKFPNEDKKTLADNLHPFIYGQDQENLVAGRKVYPLGKVEMGNTAVVFFLVPSLSYDGEDTQMSISAFGYNKKSGKIIPGQMQHHFLSIGGYLEGSNPFYYGGYIKITAGKNLELLQSGKDGQTKALHRFSKKGLDFVKNL